MPQQGTSCMHSGADFHFSISMTMWGVEGETLAFGETVKEVKCATLESGKKITPTGRIPVSEKI